MPTDNDTSAPTCATLAVTRLPKGTLTERVLLIANAAKSAAWHGGYDGQPLPADHKFIRGALALVHMLEASEAMREAPALAFLLAAEFEAHEEETASPRAKLLAMELDDPSAWMTSAVMTNRRLLGMPPQIELVPEGATLPELDTLRAATKRRQQADEDVEVALVRQAAAVRAEDEAFSRHGEASS